MICCDINAHVANGGWVPRGLAAGNTNPNPGRTPHNPALPTTQPRNLPNTAPALAPVTLRPEIQWKKTLLGKALWGEGGGSTKEELKLQTPQMRKCAKVHTY